MYVQYNAVAINAMRMVNITSDKQVKKTEKLSSGYRINRAADDAAGLAISEKMRRQIKGLTRASENVQDGISYVQTAEGALNEVQDMLHRMNVLAVQASNDTLDDTDRAALNSEVQNLKSEMDRIFDTTSFNEKLIWPKDSADVRLIGYKNVPAIELDYRHSGFDLSNENIDEMPRSAINISASAENGISFSWTGFDGKTYKTSSISLKDLKAKDYKVNLSELYKGATAGGTPVSLYKADGKTPLFDATLSFAPSAYAEDKQIIASLNGATVSRDASVGITPEWETSSSFSFAGSYLSIDAAYKSYSSKLTDAFSFDVGNDNTITPKPAGANMVSYPTATTVEEAKNDTNAWVFKFDMVGIGEVTGKVTSAYYSGGEIIPESENTWWRWVYPYAPDKRDAYKSGLSYYTSPNLKGVMDALTGPYKDGSPGLLTSANGGCSNSGGSITFTMNLTDSSGNSIGYQYLSLGISSGDTEQSVFNKVVNSFNASTSMDFNITTSNVTGGGAIYNHTESRGVVKEPVYKVTNQFSVHAGADAWQLIPITYDSLTTDILGVSSTTVKTKEASQKAIADIKGALSVVSEQRSSFGAYQNRLEHTIRNLDNVIENTTAAESQIRDEDMAKGMVEYANNNVLSQAGVSMLSQANKINQDVLSLLQ